ncbi:hypothetical protein KCP75_02045 [Salmonella enterica subsp. enterica]|nr:hypothetical protein KCP75_02045 [Salmonella enterica subsp. enterica]
MYQQLINRRAVKRKRAIRWSSAAALAFRTTAYLLAQGAIPNWRRLLPYCC